MGGEPRRTPVVVGLANIGTGIVRLRHGGLRRKISNGIWHSEAPPQMLFFEKEFERQAKHHRPFLNIQSKEEHLDKLVETF
jgi:hypothetical protein